MDLPPFRAAQTFSGRANTATYAKALSILGSFFPFLQKMRSNHGAFIFAVAPNGGSKCLWKIRLNALKQICPHSLRRVRVAYKSHVH